MEGGWGACNFAGVSGHRKLTRAKEEPQVRCCSGRDPGKKGGGLENHVPGTEVVEGARDSNRRGRFWIMAKPLSKDSSRGEYSLGISRVSNSEYLG